MALTLSSIRWHFSRLVETAYRKASHRRQNNARGYLTFELHVPGMGLFAHLSWIAHALHWAESRQLQLDFTCTNNLYQKKGQTGDWLVEVLLQKNPRTPSLATNIIIRNYSDFVFARHSPPQANTAGCLVLKKFSLPEPLLEFANDFAARNFKDRFVIGLHYRGTDKGTEAPTVSPQEAFKTLRSAVELLSGHLSSGPVIFLATDSIDFHTLALREFADLEIVTQTGITRSSGSVGVHALKDKDGRAAAREAMLDCYFLGRAHLLIKSCSALSAWSALLGRKAPVVFMNRPFDGTNFYPDSALLNTARSPNELPAAIQEALGNYITA